MKQSEILRNHVKNSNWLSDLDKQRYNFWAKDFEEKEMQEEKNMENDDKTCWVLPKESIEQVLVLSTAHLLEEECLALENHCSYKCNEGFLLPITEDDYDFEVESEHFKHIIRLARKSGFSYIMFDCDGPILDALKKFDW
jgi:hypothetical protein